MSAPSTSRQFKANARAALQDGHLKAALARAKPGFIDKRAKARAALPEFDALRDAAQDMKARTLKDLDTHLENFETKAKAAGSVVYWASDDAEARRIILDICAQTPKKGSKHVITKGKSMISEEINLNAALEEAGHSVVETDLGEYIIQLRGERPSHIIAPAIHTTRPLIEKDFRKAHTHLEAGRSLEAPEEFVAEAREVLRGAYFDADIGITGANMLIAETGQTVIVTNEGNGDMTQSLAHTHIVIASIEKVVPGLDDASLVLRLLGRSATGQEMSVYTTFSSGPRRKDDPDGPSEQHIVLLDNGRSTMLGTVFEDMLRCIRCGACMNHCPVYEAIGGHAYGWVYPGPMGAVLTPALIGVKEAGHLPNASTFCGRCEAVCPMRIPLPKMMRHWRERERGNGDQPALTRLGLSLWKLMATRPKTYRRVLDLKLRALKLLETGGRLRRIPTLKAWQASREFPAPAARRSFVSQWRQQERRAGKGKAP